MNLATCRTWALAVSVLAWTAVAAAHEEEQALSGATSRAASEPATEAASQPAEASPSIWDRETLTNGWLGMNEELEKKGLSVKLGLTQVYQQNLNGGLSTHRHAGRYVGSYELEIEADLQKLVGLTGGHLYMLTRGGWSNGITPTMVGSLSNADQVAIDNRSVDVWQLYYEQDFFGDKVRVRVGKIDLTGAFECRGCKVAFDGNAFANDEFGQFLNGWLVNNPTIPFPEPGLAAVVHVEPVEGFYLAAAVADADADVRETGFNTTFHGPADFFNIYEMGVLTKFASANGPLQGGYRMGLWYDPRQKEVFGHEDDVNTDDVGFYTSCDQMLWKENNKADDTQGLGAFGRYGLADAAVNEVKSFWSTGLQYKGLAPGRDDDVLGFGVGQGRLSRQAGLTKSNETVMELYYGIAVTKWLQVTPDVQYIFNPGGEGLSDAVVVGVRVQMTF